jgi:hypothetical protein
MKEIAEENGNGYVVIIYLIIHILSTGVREGGVSPPPLTTTPFPC